MEKDIVLNEEEKDFLVATLNNHLFTIKDMVLAWQILEKIDEAFPIKSEG